jgi:hypothetical protein
METEIRALLTGSTAITDLVPAARINFGTHPQGAGYPAIVLNVIGGAEGLTMNGTNNLTEGRLQVDCYGVTYASPKQVSDAVKALLHGYRDAAFRIIQHITTRDSREGGSNEADRPYRCSLDFSFAWRQTS